MAWSKRIAVVSWPAEADRRRDLADRDEPRLLVVAEGCEPPRPLEGIEDWVREQAPAYEYQARLAELAWRAQRHHRLVPFVQEGGVLRVGSSRVLLPPLEERLARLLADRLGRVVSRRELSRAAWPGRPQEGNALDVHILRLRQRIAPLGLAIRTVRSRGYLLERQARSELPETNGPETNGPGTEQ